jgi:hypothetical protein
VAHQPTKVVRFILGGTDEKRYPAFNGLLTQVSFNAKAGAYIGTIDGAKKFIETYSPKPNIAVNELVSNPIVADEVERQPQDKPTEATVTE